MMSKLSKLNGAAAPQIPNTCDLQIQDIRLENEPPDQKQNVAHVFSAYNSESGVKNISKYEDEKKVLRFTMLFNKFNKDLDVKKNLKVDDDEKHKKDVKCTMYFNKDVTIRSNIETPPFFPLSMKSLEAVKISEKHFSQTSLSKTSRSLPSQRFGMQKSNESGLGHSQISEPAMMFSHSLTSPAVDVHEIKSLANLNTEHLKKILSKKNTKIDNKFVRLITHSSAKPELRPRFSLTSVLKENKLGIKGVLKNKIPSLTSIDMNSVTSKPEITKFNYWDDLKLTQKNLDKPLNLQISKSNNDNNRRSVIKFRKEDAASASDSKLLNTVSEVKKQIKKCDKKSRGDSSKREKDAYGRKQVQWKTEVDVIYFSTDLVANGDRSGEVISRVMEPLREEWEQQRKGFYAKMVPYYMENHLKDRFISLLKI